MHPGEFPATEFSALRHLQVSTDKHIVADHRNLYWLHRGDDMNVFSGCGLGGGSLVNANVSIEPDPNVFADPRWPAELSDPGELADGFR